jgi:hypothetical protein
MLLQKFGQYDTSKLAPQEAYLKAFKEAAVRPAEHGR